MAKFYTEVTELNQKVVINTTTKEEANFLDVMRVVSYGLQSILESYDEYIYQPKTENLPQIYYCLRGDRVDYLALAVDLIKEYMITNVAEFQFVNKILYSDMSIGSTIDPAKTPIAIQVAPSNHFQDGKARWMSLVNMSLQTPNTGTTATGNDIQTNPGAGIIWGSPSEFGQVIENVASLKYKISGEDLVGFLPELADIQGNYGYVPGDLMKACNEHDGNTNFPYPLDERFDYNGEEFYATSLTDDGVAAIPSPYDKNGRLNPWGRLYAMSQENGYTLTDLLLQNQTVAWEDTATIDNSYVDRDGYNFPAACVCRRFTPFDNQGYLPSICELQYLGINLGAINTLLSGITGSIAVGDYLTVGDGGFGDWLWSSLENRGGAWNLNTNDCSVSGNARTNSYGGSRVRAFLAY